MDPTIVAQLAVGGGALLGGLGYAIRQVSTALARRSEARSRQIEAEAEADKIRASAEADVQRAEAQIDASQAEVIAATLAAYETRLQKAEQRAERAERVAADLVRWAERVAYEMRRRGLTPPDMPAVALADGGE